MRKIEIAKEGLPEWATPVFVVDQDAKGVLGRMVCAYGPLNKELLISSFPSADPTRAFSLAAFKKHHSVVDAIWGYTQFLVDKRTQQTLTICAHSGLYQWLRMPFGPAPAPAEMQAYVQQRFANLRDRHNKEFVSALMDDIKVSSPTFPEHVEDMQELLKEAKKSGFEFKLTKGQFNQPEIELWGCVCGEYGRKPAVKKVSPAAPAPTR